MYPFLNATYSKKRLIFSIIKHAHVTQEVLRLSWMCPTRSGIFFPDILDAKMILGRLVLLE